MTHAIVFILDPYELDAEDSIGGLCNKFLQSSPSVVRNKKCSIPSCSEINKHQTNQVLLGVNHHAFGEGFEKFKNLQRNIILGPRNPTKCEKEECQGMLTDQLVLQNHIWIELDVRPTPEFDFGLHCRLDDLPQHLQFNHRYRLTGIISVVRNEGQKNHFIAYYRNDTSIGHCWLECNDLAKEITSCDNSLVIEPMAVLYIIDETVGNTN